MVDDTPVTSYVVQTDPRYRFDGPFMTEQRAWLRDGLATSRARWKLVLSHHPYWNNGAHRSAGHYDGVPVGDYFSGRHFKEWIEQDVLGRADYLLAGHDHSLQVLDSGPTRQVVCGAAAKSESRGKDSDGHPALIEHYDTHGFAIATFTPDDVALEMHTVDVETAVAEVAYQERRALTRA